MKGAQGTLEETLPMKTLSLKEKPFDFFYEFDDYENGLLESDPELELDFDEFETEFDDLEEEEEVSRRPCAAGAGGRSCPPRCRTTIRPWRVLAGAIDEPLTRTCPGQTCPQHSSAYIDLSPNSAWAWTESEVSPPREYIPAEEMERRYPLKGASESFTKFRSLVYEAQVNMARRAKKKFIRRHRGDILC
jgi:hypothetical protein